MNNSNHFHDINSKVFGNVVKHGLPYLIYLVNQNLNLDKFMGNKIVKTYRYANNQTNYLYTFTAMTSFV